MRQNQTQWNEYICWKLNSRLWRCPKSLSLFHQQNAHLWKQKWYENKSAQMFSITFPIKIEYVDGGRLGNEAVIMTKFQEIRIDQTRGGEWIWIAVPFVYNSFLGAIISISRVYRWWKQKRDYWSHFHKFRSVYGTKNFDFFLNYRRNKDFNNRTFFTIFYCSTTATVNPKHIRKQTR